MGELFKTRTTCRICGSDVKECLSLGTLAVSDFISSGCDINYAPLTLVQCKNEECELVQLKDTVDQDTLYEKYWYQSGFNKTMISWLKDIYDKITILKPLTGNEVVYDIGANDGTFLSFFPDTTHTIGIDPAKNITTLGKQKCSEFINGYFEYNDSFAKADIITSIAMFYDLEDPKVFVNGIKKLLKKDGIWVIQLMDLYSMLTTNAFDNMCNEHLEYYSMKTMTYLLNQFGLEIFDGERNEVNGGSIRLFVAHRGERVININVETLLNEEAAYLGSFSDPLQAFTERVVEIKNKIYNFINNEVSSGKKIFIMGASTKGNTLLQYFNIDNNLIPFAAEVSKDKFGLKTVCSNITIIDEKEAMKANPDYFLILPWTFTDTFIKIHAKYLKNGGKFIVPCPEAAVISYNKIELL